MIKIDYNKALSVPDLTANNKEVYPDDRTDIKPKRDKARRFNRIYKLVNKQREK